MRPSLLLSLAAVLLMAGQVSSASKQPDSVMIESIDFNETSVSDAILFLKQQAAAQGVVVNFVILLPKDEASKPVVTLSLKDVPFLTALDYICRMSGLESAMEKDAIVLKSAR